MPVITGTTSEGEKVAEETTGESSFSAKLSSPSISPAERIVERILASLTFQTFFAVFIVNFPFISIGKCLTNKDDNRRNDRRRTTHFVRST